MVRERWVWNIYIREKNTIPTKIVNFLAQNSTHAHLERSYFHARNRKYFPTVRQSRELEHHFLEHVYDLYPFRPSYVNLIHKSKEVGRGY